MSYKQAGGWTQWCCIGCLPWLRIQSLLVHNCGTSHFTQDGQNDPVAYYVVLDMAYKFCCANVPPHHLMLKKGVLVVFIRNLLHLIIVNGKMLVVEAHTRRVIQFRAVHSNENNTSTYSLHCIKFQFSCRGVRVTRMQFSLHVAFTGPVHKGQEQTLKKMVVDLCSSFSPQCNFMRLSFEWRNLLIRLCCTNRVTLRAPSQQFTACWIQSPNPCSEKQFSLLNQICEIALYN